MAYKHSYVDGTGTASNLPPTHWYGDLGVHLPLEMSGPKCIFRVY